MYLIGVDIGTSSSKAIAIDAKGLIVASSHRAYGIQEPQPGYRVQDSAALLMAALEIITEVVNKLPSNVQIVGIGFSAAMHSLVAVDKSGTALSALIIWADNRSAKQAAFLKNCDQAAYLYENCGVPFHSMTPLCKLMWIKENDPELLSRTYKFISIKEYILFHLTGKFVVDYSIASATGMFNLHSFEWDEVALRFAGVTVERLSAPVPIFHRLEMNFSPGIAHYKLTGDIPLIVGGSDGCLANIGSGVIQDKDLAVTIGTSAAVRVTSAQPQPDKNQRLFNYILTPQLFVSGGASNNGTVLLNWMAGQVLTNKEYQNPAKFVAAAMKAPAGCKGLLFLPYLLGERAPVWDANATGTISGLRFDHNQADMMRALIEGITMNLQTIIHNLFATTGNMNRIIASGGFTKSAEWVQMLCDMTNIPVVVNNTEDASALGAAIVAGYSLGIFTSLSGVTIPATTAFFPHAATHAVYKANSVKFAELYQQNF